MTIKSILMTTMALCITAAPSYAQVIAPTIGAGIAAAAAPAPTTIVQHAPTSQTVIDAQTIRLQQEQIRTQGTEQRAQARQAMANARTDRIAERALRVQARQERAEFNR